MMFPLMSRPRFGAGVGVFLLLWWVSPLKAELLTARVESVWGMMSRVQTRMQREGTRLTSEEKQRFRETESALVSERTGLAQKARMLDEQQQRLHMQQGALEEAFKNIQEERQRLDAERERYETECQQSPPEPARVQDCRARATTINSATEAFNSRLGQWNADREANAAALAALRDDTDLFRKKVEAWEGEVRLFVLTVEDLLFQRSRRGGRR